MHFVLVGPGALGCLLSCIVAKGMEAGDRLTLLDHSSERAGYLTSQGIAYYLGDQVEQVRVTAVSEPKRLDAVDVILLCVKSYDVTNALEFCKPFISDQTLIIFLQNGISHLALQDRLSGGVAAFGTTTEGATLLKSGHVRHAGSGVTYLGFLQTPSAHSTQLLQKTRDILSSGGVQVEITESILTKIWAKLFINVGINGLTAILGCKNGDLLTLPGIVDRMESAICEAQQIAKAKGIPVIDDPYRATRTVCRKTAKNISSMLQDIRNNRKTEIDSINGAIEALGKELNIATPENNLLCRQVKELEAGFATKD